MSKAIGQFLERFRLPNPLDKKVVRESSTQSRAMQNVKCNCCETRLTSLDKETKSFIAKYSKCGHCGHYVCRNCRERSKCHECAVKLSIVCNPDYLMKKDKQKLLAMLKTLHYKDNVFDSWEKPFLVKQLLTRFQAHEDWDPRHYNATEKWVGATVQITETAAAPTSAEAAAEATRAPKTRKETESAPEAAKPRSRHQKPPRKNRPETTLPATSIPNMKFQQVGEHIYTLPFKETSPFFSQQDVQIRVQAAPAIPRQTRSMIRVTSLSLEDIPSANYFEGLSTEEMKSILKKSIDSKSVMGQDELKFILLKLWTKTRKDNGKTMENAAYEPADSLREPQMRPYLSERHLNRTAADDDDDDDGGDGGDDARRQSRKPPLAVLSRHLTQEQDKISKFSSSMGALNLLDTKEKRKSSRLPTSTSFRETTASRSVGRHSASAKKVAQLQEGRRVKDMRAIFESKQSEDEQMD